MVTTCIKHKVYYSPSSWSHRFSYRGNNWKRNWLGLELIHVTAKLTIFPVLSLQEVYTLPLLFFFFHDAPFGRNRLEQAFAHCIHWLPHLHRGTKRYVQVVSTALLYSGGPWFISCLIDGCSWLHIVIVFLSHSRQKVQQHLKKDHNPFLLHAYISVSNATYYLVTLLPHYIFQLYTAIRCLLAC
jgi:hypothetical protein